MTRNIDWESRVAQTVDIPGARHGRTSNVQQNFAARVRAEARKRGLQAHVNIAASQAAAHVRLSQATYTIKVVDEFTREVTFAQYGGRVVRVVRGWKALGGEGWIGEDCGRAFPSIKAAARDALSRKLRAEKVA